jgi:hypothetical protein
MARVLVPIAEGSEELEAVTLIEALATRELRETVEARLQR